MTKFSQEYMQIIMVTDKDNISTLPFAERVRLGVQKALRKLAEESALKGESLVVKIEGEVKEVPAKDLLANMPKAR
ncbi:hypothetical protein FXV77_21505 [Sphingobacterium phlebotomi]|uniref:Uncharacterized protein n=3 Tax=Sphingobacterium TaxID=28453 RepID=A0A5D4GS66_9SPHI|nr:hypothetical protein [Sphingobacterium phlebotomi]TYR31198.1 hypothetical protein FXV77_21505 [Sphingobacterium phlebotomi]